MAGEITDVDFAGNFQKSIRDSDGRVQYADESIKEQIMSAKPSDMLKVVLTVNSPIKILKVEKLDANWFSTQIT
jgi:hypothetical protein